MKFREWLGVLILSGMAFIWELFSYLGMIDLERYSHPFAIIHTFGNSTFMYGLLDIVIQTVSVTLVGAFLGIACGALVARSSSLSWAVVRFVRVGRWIPFFVAWSLPVWDLPQPSVPNVNVLLIFALATVAVVLTACYEYLTVSFTLGINWRDGRSNAWKRIVLQALFICLLSESWMWPRWNWYIVIGRPLNVAVGYSALIILVSILQLLNRLTRSSFTQEAELNGLVLRKENFGNKRYTWILVLLATGSIGLWQLLAETRLRLVIGNPLEVSSWLLKLFNQGMSPIEGPLWQHVRVSLLEVLGGTLLGGGLGLIVCRSMSRSSSVRDWLNHLLPATQITPIIIYPLLVVWTPFIGIDPWRTGLGAGLLTFFPFIEALWGLRNERLSCQILLAIDKALPYAFVAMFFGEAMSGVAGVGFSIIVLRHIDAPLAEGIALVCLILTVWIIVSFTLRVAGRWCCDIGD